MEERRKWKNSRTGPLPLLLYARMPTAFLCPSTPSTVARSTNNPFALLAEQQPPPAKRRRKTTDANEGTKNQEKTKRCEKQRREYQIVKIAPQQLN